MVASEGRWRYYWRALPECLPFCSHSGPAGTGGGVVLLYKQGFCTKTRMCKHSFRSFECMDVTFNIYILARAICRSLWIAGRRDPTLFGVVDDTTTTKFTGRACAVHCNLLPVVVNKVVVVVLKFPIFQKWTYVPEKKPKYSPLAR